MYLMNPKIKKLKNGCVQVYPLCVHEPTFSFYLGMDTYIAKYDSSHYTKVLADQGIF